MQWLNTFLWRKWWATILAVKRLSVAILRNSRSDLIPGTDTIIRVGPKRRFCNLLKIYINVVLVVVVVSSLMQGKFISLLCWQILKGLLLTFKRVYSIAWIKPESRLQGSRLKDGGEDKAAGVDSTVYSSSWNFLSSLCTAFPLCLALYCSYTLKGPLSTSCMFFPPPCHIAVTHFHVSQTKQSSVNNSICIMIPLMLVWGDNARFVCLRGAIGCSVPQVVKQLQVVYVFFMSTHTTACRFDFTWYASSRSRGGKT